MAYDWTNLYLCCSRCNRRHKHDLFPLADSRLRVEHHRDAHLLGREKPLFIDPGSDEPSEHLEFRREYVAPRAGSLRGKTTIKELGLGRDALVEERRDCRKKLLLLLEGLWVALAGPAPDPTWCRKAVAALVDACSDSAEYSAMTRATLHAAIPWRRIGPADDPAVVLQDLRAGRGNGNAIDTT